MKKLSNKILEYENLTKLIRSLAIAIPLEPNEIRQEFGYVELTKLISKRDKLRKAILH